MMNEKLLAAIGDIDDAVIRDAKEKTGIPQKGRRISFRRVVTVLVAAMLVLALAGTVAAAAINSADWFMDLFAERTGGFLNPGQQGYIEENVETVGKTDVALDCTVTLESAVFDGKTVLIRLRVTAPEGTVLDAEHYSFEIMELMVSGREYHRYPRSISNGNIEDTDGLPNTLDILVAATVEEMQDLGDRQKWKLIVGELMASDLDPETGALNETVAQNGTWEFDLEFESRGGAVGLVDEPVEAWGVYNMSYEKDIPILVTSVQLRALSMELRYVYPDPEDTWGSLDMWDVVVVLKDGTEVAAQPQMSSYGVDGVGEMWFEMSAPIVLEEVDCVILHNGVKLPMPAETE